MNQDDTFLKIYWAEINAVVCLRLSVRGYWNAARLFCWPLFWAMRIDALLRAKREASVRANLFALPIFWPAAWQNGIRHGRCNRRQRCQERTGTAQHRDDRDDTRAFPHLHQVADDPNPYAPPKCPEAAALLADRRVSKGAIAAVWLCVLITIVTVMFLPVRLPSLKLLMFCALALFPVLLVKLILAAAYPSGDLDQR